MIDLQTLTKPLETALKANAVLIAALATVERSTRMNVDPGRCPWVGVYPGPDVGSEPKSLTSGNARWNNLVDLTVVVQTSSYNTDGQAASDLLETLAQEVLAVVNADLTLAVPGARVIKAARKYMYLVFDDKETGDLFMPQVNITLKLEVRSV
jgi:hypothetical protein